MNPEPFAAQSDQSAARRLRLVTLIFPPAGLWLLWRGPAGIGRKLFGSVGVGLFSLVYAAAILFLLHRFTGLRFEMQGRPIPIPTWQTTDYARLEKARSEKAGSAPAKATPAEAKAKSPPYWTDFRGPNRDGHYTEQPINVDWAKSPPKLLWKQPVGGGYASFVVAEGLAFTIEQRRELEAVTAYEVETGREVWAHSYPAHFQEWMGGEGPRATPTWHEGRLYSLGGTGQFRCLEAATGKLLWQHDLFAENSCLNLFFAVAASPLIVDDKVLVLAGDPQGRDGRMLIAYDKVSGAPVWKEMQDKAAYSSPMLVTLAGERQLLVHSAGHLLGVSPADGKALWRFPWRVEFDNTIAQPIVTGTNRLVLSAGYGTGAVGLELNRADSGFAVKELWRNKFLKNKFTSSVLHNGHLYGLDEDILVCLDATTGERRWKDGRYGYGQLLLASGHLVILCGDGDLALVQALPDRHVEVARIPAIKGKTWNHPAIAGGKLLVRNAIEMACFDLR
ncbi:MAG: WD40 repeat-like protein [Limisphaerales bacterium]|nr:MAG: WD40 repeat-like protein [Limisphaerales bacterium]KAG0509868.1 MAG: WD40 repeat-like protein [Limisphaerales bacterium]TXT50910.1 MAG: WD40 repeat-like protein [Limisphaerales bacterium]